MGGLPVSELNTLELEFLKLNNYSLFVTIDELQKYGDNILHHWNHSQDSEPVVVKDITNNNDEIARPFSRLTMQTKCTPGSTPVDKHWRYSNGGSRQNFVKSNTSGNGTAETATAAGEALRRI